MIDSKDYQMSFISVCKYLNDIVRKNDAFNCGKIEYTRVLGSDNSAALRCPEHPVGSRGYRTNPMAVEIGVKSLMDNLSADCYARNDDIARVFYQAFYENAHIWQYGVAYMQPPENSSDLIKEMAKMYAVGSYFHELREMWHRIDPSEIMANRHAALAAKLFVQEMRNAGYESFNYIDIDKRAYDYCFSLYGRWEKDLFSDKTAEVVADGLTRMLEDVVYFKKFRPENIAEFRSLPEEQHLSLFELLADSETMAALEAAKYGFEEMDILCKYIAKRKPLVFRGLLCVRDSYVGAGMSGKFELLSGKMLGVRPREFVPLSTLRDADEFVLEKE